jgi:hypothetical protein
VGVKKDGRNGTHGARTRSPQTLSALTNGMAGKFVYLGHDKVGRSIMYYRVRAVPCVHGL